MIVIALGPLTKRQIELRGPGRGQERHVGVGSVLDTLVDHGLVATAGFREDLPGQPRHYWSTKLANEPFPGVKALAAELLSPPVTRMIDGASIRGAKAPHEPHRGPDRPDDGAGCFEGPEGGGVSQTRPGDVALVGAGPGDPGLLTLRGADRLRSAQVVSQSGRDLS